MKCIHCRNDAKYKDRSDKKCPTCHHPFAFEPQTGDPVTDSAFESAIDKVSSDGKVKWTKEHLYYELCKHKRRGKTLSLVFGVAGALCLTGAAMGTHLLVFVVVLVILFWTIAVRSWPSPEVAIPESTFDSLWNRWLRAHGTPKAVIVRKALPAPGTARQLPADIQEYSFDRAVICDREETVDLLLANNFHFENNCAVLSASGYPPQAWGTVRGMLRKNPKLAVYVLHDASMEGCGLAKKLASSGDWFASSARIVDVGLSPTHAKKLKGLWRPTSFVARDPTLSSSDNAWLERYSLELAVIRPEQVIKRLFRAISGAKETSDSPDSGTLMLDTGSFGGDATVSDGGGDSFG